MGLVGAPDFKINVQVLWIQTWRHLGQNVSGNLVYNMSMST